MEDNKYLTEKQASEYFQINEWQEAKKLLNCSFKELIDNTSDNS